MVTSAAELTALSDAFRAKAQSLSSALRARLVDLLQVAFGVRARRNAELWVTAASSRRNFCSRQSSALEQEMRIVFAQAFLNEEEENFPVKVHTFVGSLKQQGLKLRLWLQDDYIQGALSRVEVTLTNTTLYCAAYTDTPDQFPDSITEEFSGRD